MPTKRQPQPQTPAGRYNHVAQVVKEMAADPEEAFRLVRAMLGPNEEAAAILDRAVDIHFDRSVADVNHRHGHL